METLDHTHPNRLRRERLHRFDVSLLLEILLQLVDLVGPEKVDFAVAQRLNDRFPVAVVSLCELAHFLDKALADGTRFFQRLSIDRFSPPHLPGIDEGLEGVPVSPNGFQRLRIVGNRLASGVLQ